MTSNERILADIIEEFLADQETLNEPYRNEAICERAREALKGIRLTTTIVSDTMSHKHEEGRTDEI